MTPSKSVALPNKEVEAYDMQYGPRFSLCNIYILPAYQIWSYSVLRLPF